MTSNEKEVNNFSNKMENFVNIYKDKKTNPKLENISNKDSEINISMISPPNNANYNFGYSIQDP
jgi:hypothetical protein